jgi:hypothetical protein
MPLVVGVPLIVISLAFQLADTPAGSPLNELIPVAPVVVIVIFVNGLLMHSVGVEEAALAEFAGVTMMVPVANTEPQPPLNGIE